MVYKYEPSIENEILNISEMLPKILLEQFSIKLVTFDFSPLSFFIHIWHKYSRLGGGKGTYSNTFQVTAHGKHC